MLARKLETGPPPAKKKPGLEGPALKRRAAVCSIAARRRLASNCSPRWRLSSLTFGVSPQIERKLGNGRVESCIWKATAKTMTFYFQLSLYVIHKKGICVLLISFLAVCLNRAPLLRWTKHLHTFPQARLSKNDRDDHGQLSFYDDRLRRPTGASLRRLLTLARPARRFGGPRILVRFGCGWWSILPGTWPIIGGLRGPCCFASRGSWRRSFPMGVSSR